ncbi:MAG TPA: BlaI/MecI/CopY family transcriptional regulator [Terriglobia bacterium]|nr:BlaI/MecI/CopY family transcriptional regulator [Terriglobia bacterium]
MKTEETVQTRHNSLALTPLELDIMKAVWRNNPITVRDVQVAIQPDRPLAYTTVMTVMHRLHLKGFLNRTLRTKAHYYEPRVEFTDVRDAVVSGVIRHFFRGSRDEFVQFLENDDVTLPEVSAPNALDETLL